MQKNFKKTAYDFLRRVNHMLEFLRAHVNMVYLAAWHAIFWQKNARAKAQGDNLPVLDR